MHYLIEHISWPALYASRSGLDGIALLSQILCLEVAQLRQRHPRAYNDTDPSKKSRQVEAQTNTTVNWR